MSFQNLAMPFLACSNRLITVGLAECLASGFVAGVYVAKLCGLHDTFKRPTEADNVLAS